MRLARIPLNVLLALFVLAVGFFPDRAGSATPRRPAGSYYFGPEVVYTNGAQGDFFQPLSDPLPSRGLSAGRVSMEVTEVTSNNIKMRPALRWSVDGVNWDSAVYINVNYVTGNGSQATTGFTDFIPLGSPKPFVQFGVLTYTVAGSNFEMGHVVLIVEPKAATQ